MFEGTLEQIESEERAMRRRLRAERKLLPELDVGRWRVIEGVWVACFGRGMRLWPDRWRGWSYMYEPVAGVTQHELNVMLVDLGEALHVDERGALTADQRARLEALYGVRIDPHHNVAMTKFVKTLP